MSHMTADENMTELQCNFINGQWVPTEGVSENRNPANPEDLIGLYARGSAADVDQAVEAARAALPTVFAKALDRGVSGMLLI